MERIILLGGGKHCGSVIDSIRAQGIFDIVGILDMPDKIGEVISGVPVIGNDDEMIEYYAQGITHAFITVGSVGDSSIRQKLYARAKAIGFEFPNIIDPTAIVSKDVSLGIGNFIGKGAIVNINAKIGSHNIINSGTIVEHDCVLEDFIHLAPGTTLSGGVSIGHSTHIGTNTTIIQEINVGNDTLIGAGSVVIADIGPNKIAYGNPCKEK